MFDIIEESMFGRALALATSRDNKRATQAFSQHSSKATDDVQPIDDLSAEALAPINWSLAKKNFVLIQICLLTFAVYAGSAIYTPGILEISSEFHVGSVVTTLGLTLFVIGYSLGPAIWTIFSEDARFGRSPVIVGTLVVFVLLQVGCAMVHNLAGLLIMRFLAGVFGSPALAIPAGMIFDMYPPTQAAYAIAIWGSSAAAGPTMGPLLSGYAVMKESWRWSFWILLWMSGLALLVLFFFLPETLLSNIKSRRYRISEDERAHMAESEEQRKKSSAATGKMIFTLTFTEPIALSLALYIALLYGILYVWFESFPIVYQEIYGFNTGEMGVVYLGIAIGVLIAMAGYFTYVAKVVNPSIRRDGHIRPVERRLQPAFITSFCIPICLFMFGWSAGRTHWIVPTIGTCFFGAGVFLAFQSVIIYLGDAYQQNSPAAMAGNALIRGGFGAAFPLFGRALFINLGNGSLVQGVAWGSSLLGFISLVFFPIPFVLYRYGSVLRKRSPLAAAQDPVEDEKKGEQPV